MISEFLSSQMPFCLFRRIFFPPLSSQLERKLPQTYCTPVWSRRCFILPPTPLPPTCLSTSGILCVSQCEFFKRIARSDCRIHGIHRNPTIGQRCTWAMPAKELSTRKMAQEAINAFSPGAPPTPCFSTKRISFFSPAGPFKPLPCFLSMRFQDGIYWHYTAATRKCCALDYSGLRNRSL